MLGSLNLSTRQCAIDEGIAKIVIFILSFAYHSVSYKLRSNALYAAYETISVVFNNCPFNALVISHKERFLKELQKSGYFCI